MNPDPAPAPAFSRAAAVRRTIPAVVAVVAVVARPGLWPSAARLLPPRWWQRWPPRPWPPAEYVRFRTETMYGPEARLDPADIVRYLEWCRRMGHSAR